MTKWPPPAECRRLLFQVDETRYDFLRTLEHLRKGDVAYASPEYLRGEELIPASDLFSLGMVLVELPDECLFG